MDKDNRVDWSESRTKKWITRNAIIISVPILVVLTVLAAHYLSRLQDSDYADSKQEAATRRLCKAISDGDVDAVKWHISHGTDLNRPNRQASDWCHPLTFAMLYNRYEIAELLIDGGALPDPPGFRTPEGIIYDSPLAHALQLRKEKDFKFLLDHGADPNAKIERSTTLLNYAVLEGEAFVHLLVDAGAKVNVSDSNGLTPLHLAAVDRRPSVVSYLLASGAEPNARDKYGRTPLHVACRQRENTKQLLAAGADPGIRADMENRTVVVRLQSSATSIRLFSGKSAIAPTERKNWTVLHCGAMIGDEDYVKLLLEHGARVDITDMKRRTPLDVARLEGRAEIVTLLEEWIKEHPHTEEAPPGDAE